MVRNSTLLYHIVWFLPRFFFPPSIHLFFFSFFLGLSGLPAGATVDVRRKEVTATSARTSIAMQLPSGRRLQQDFDANTTLWTVLQHFESESKEKLTRNVDSAGKVLAPAVVFMNREVCKKLCKKISLFFSSIDRILPLNHIRLMLYPCARLPLPLQG